MQIVHNISLKPYNTFGIDVIAKHFVSVSSIDDLKTILGLKNYPEKLILGGGSNMLLTKNQNTLVTHINLKGISIKELGSVVKETVHFFLFSLSTKLLMIFQTMTQRSPNSFLAVR